MKNIKEIFVQVFLNALIGIMVGSTYLFILLGKYIGYKIVGEVLIYSIFVGIIIGFVAEFIFKLIAYNIIKNIKTAFLLESFIVAFMTLTASYVIGVREIVYLCGMVLIALILSGVVTYFQYMRLRESNIKLKELQKRIKETTK